MSRRSTFLAVTVLVGAVAGTATAASHAPSVNSAGIYSVRDDGRDRRKIAVPDPPVDFLTRSPGGRSILFAREVDGVSALFAADRSGANAVRLTPPELSASFYPRTTFSPDGRTIAFSSFEQCSGQCSRWGLYVVGRDGSGLRRVADGHSPSWAPDSRRLAHDSDLGISVTDTRTGETILAARGNGHQSIWAPRGERIAYSAQIRGYGVACTVNADGSRNRCTRGHSFVSLVWSSDAKRIAFKQVTPIRLGVMDAGARHVRYLGNHGRTARPVAWSPEGKRLAFSFGAYGQFYDRVDVLRLDAPARSKTVVDEPDSHLSDVRWRGRRISYVASPPS